MLSPRALTSLYAFSKCGGVCTESHRTFTLPALPHASALHATRRLALGYYVSQLAAALTAALPGAFTFHEPAAAAGECPGGADPRAEALTPLPAPKLHVSAVAARRHDPAARDLLERAWALCLKHGVATDAAAAWDATVAPALQVILAVCLGTNPNPKP